MQDACWQAWHKGVTHSSRCCLGHIMMAAESCIQLEDVDTVGDLELHTTVLVLL